MALPALKFSINTAREIDATRTIVLRGQFVAQVNKRFRDLKGAINRLLTEDNFLEPAVPQEYQPRITLIGLAAKYEYLRSDVKVDQFMDWLKDQESQGILEIVQRPGGLRRGQSQAWTDTYIQSSYGKGIAQARADLRKAGADIPSFQSISGGVAGVFNQPFHADRVALIYTRCFNEMQGITEAMNGHLSRELALGMSEGQSPYQIARRINERVDNIGIVRGRLIARTEIVQAHNEAALNEYERAEIEIGEPVKVEWVAVMDDRTRSHHAERNGKVYERSVARGMLGEPNCRCGLAPWVESFQGKKAKDLLAKLPSAVTEEGKIIKDSIKMPFAKIGKHSDYNPTSVQFKKARDFARKNISISTIDIDIDKLIPTEFYVERSLVRKILDDFSWGKYKIGHLGREQLPRIVRFKNKYYIHDGHHRLAAAKLLKKKIVPVQLIDMDVKPKKKMPVRGAIKK